MISYSWFSLHLFFFFFEVESTPISILKVCIAASRIGLKCSLEVNLGEQLRNMVWLFYSQVCCSFLLKIFNFCGGRNFTENE